MALERIVLNEKDGKGQEPYDSAHVGHRATKERTAVSRSPEGAEMGPEREGEGQMQGDGGSLDFRWETQCHVQTKSYTWKLYKVINQ